MSPRRSKPASKKSASKVKASLKSPGLEEFKKVCARVEAGLKALEERMGSVPLPAAAGPARAAEKNGSLSPLGWLGAGEFKLLAGFCRPLNVAAGQVLFAEGDEGDDLYILEEGLLEIFKKDFLGDLRIAEIKPGGIVGEMALIEGKPRSANARAIQDSKVLALSRAKYAAFKHEHPAAATKLQDELLRMFSIRLRQTTEKMMGRV